MKITDEMVKKAIKAHDNAWQGGSGPGGRDGMRAAIESVLPDIEEIIEALRPFAEFSERFIDPGDGGGLDGEPIDISACHAARAVFLKLGGNLRIMRK
jgi:hypothetical protein